MFVDADLFDQGWHKFVHERALDLGKQEFGNLAEDQFG